MDTYDYREAVKEDVKRYIEDNWTEETIKAVGDYDEFVEKVNEDCWIDDSVTGNASGSYYCNTWKAEEALCHNWDLMAEACEEFGGNCGEWFEKGAEFCDVSIRCYLLGEAIGEALEELGIDADYFDTEDEDEDEDVPAHPLTDEEQEALLMKVFG